MPHEGMPFKFEPTDEQRKDVEIYTALGNTQEQIALILGVSIDTVQRHFRAELDAGLVKANARVGGKLYEKAMSGDNASIFFWLKTRARWRESPQRHELTGPDGGPIESLDLTHMTEEELLEWKRLRAKITGAADVDRPGD